MKKLQQYHLHIGHDMRAQKKYSKPFFPLTVPFNLRAFHCTFTEASPALFCFLKSQLSIEDFSAPNMLPPNPPRSAILPCVKSVAGTLELLKQLNAFCSHC